MRAWTATNESYPSEKIDILGQWTLIKCWLTFGWNETNSSKPFLCWNVW